jgi:hypothetical protein
MKNNFRLFGLSFMAFLFASLATPNGAQAATPQIAAGSG